MEQEKRPSVWFVILAVILLGGVVWLTDYVLVHYFPIR